MTQTLTQLIASVQAQLIDDGTRFSTATCTAAIRSALSMINHRIPINAADTIEAVTNTREYEVTDALYITDVLEDDEDGDDYIPLSYDEYYEDSRAYFKLRYNPSAGDVILARYAKAHTVSGLDSATDSTLTADQDQVLIDGACMKALALRAAARVETINLQQQVSDNYREAMNAFAAAFEMGIQFYERRRTPETPESRPAGWDI